jgi:guanylate kinase
MAHWAEFDYVVVNDEFGHALAELQAIVRGSGEGSRRERAGLAELAVGLSAPPTSP